MCSVWNRLDDFRQKACEDSRCHGGQSLGQPRGRTAPPVIEPIKCVNPFGVTTSERELIDLPISQGIPNPA